MKKIIKAAVILGGIITGVWAIFALLVVLNKNDEDDECEEYGYDDLECISSIDDIDIDVD